jgi:leucyl-tRNA synthetase
MSKSRGNVVTPDSVVERYGADVTRLYILFIAPFEASAVWEVEEDGVTPQHIEGVRRFHERVWRLVQAGKVGPAGGEADEALRRALHRTVRDVTAEIEAMRYNTAISALMTFASALEDYRGRHGDTVCFYEARRALALLLAPMAPFIAEEAWRTWGEAGSVHYQRWPEYDAELARPAEVTVAVQVDGRVRDRVTVPADADEATVRAAALAAPAVRRAVDGRVVGQVIVVPGKVVNVVTG